MSISTKSTYGIRAMFRLALYYKNNPIPAAYISKREGISIPYLEQLLNRLRKKDLVKSVRGPAGGYVLAKNPKRITVRDIVKALDGEIIPVHCAASAKFNKTSCGRIDKCVTKALWRKMKGALDAALRSVSLEDLCEDAKKMGIDRAVDHKYIFNI